MSQAEQEATDKPISNRPKNISEKGYRCVCLNARSIVNKKNEFNIMVEDIDPHIIGNTESWAIIDITDSELGLTGYVMFRKDRIGRRGGGVIYILFKGECIIMGYYNHGHIQWNSLESTGSEDQQFLFLIQDSFLTQHVLEPTRGKMY